jgi:hypothetical protein
MQIVRVAISQSYGLGVEAVVGSRLGASVSLAVR